MKVNYVASLILAYVLHEKFDAKIAQCEINEEEFYCDFITKDAISNKDFLRIEKEMKKVISNPLEITESLLSKDIAWNLSSNEFYHELISETKNDKVDIISLRNKFFIVKNHELEANYKEIKEFKLSNVGGVYWKANANNAQLTRIYGYAFNEIDELLRYETVINDRKERDHRKIGAEMELFTFNILAGQGLPIWLPKGTSIKHQIETYVHDSLERYEYQFVQTPVLGSIDLYKTSGHWDHYRQNMFAPITIDNETLVLRPMTCPHHLLVYKHKLRSYRELPFRMAEHAILHRYEASGALTGLERVRAMQLVDTHTVITNNQIVSEISRAFIVITEILKGLNVTIDHIDLSLHDPNNKEKFFDNPKMWHSAEQQLKQAIDQLGYKYNAMIGEAAFYGPKIDMQVKTALGHVITVSTIQLDFLLPERFDLKYIDENGQSTTPVVLHCGIIGTFERFVSILLEQTKGILPLWLSPIQIAIIPVIEKHYEYANYLKKEFLKHGIRIMLDDTTERVGKKIRQAQISKIPYQLVIGDEEVESRTLSYREYGSNEVIKVSLEKFIGLVNERIKNKN